MRIEPLTAIGDARGRCETTIRVAAGLKTLAAKRGAWQRENIGVPVDQCGKRADFAVDGVPTCRAHAGAAALAHLLRYNHERPSTMPRYDDIDPRDIDPNTNRPYAGYSSPSLDTSFHDHEMDVDQEDTAESLLREAADHLNGALGAAARPGSDSGEIYSRIQAFFAKDRA